MTAPAPLVVYQSTELVTIRDPGSYEPPETATPELEAEATGVVGEPSDGLDAEVEVVLEEVAVLAVLAVLLDVDVVPGTVWALTAPSKPTPATALNATPTVILLSRRIAASRA